MDETIDNVEKEINNKNAVEERIKNLVGGKKEAEAKAEAEVKARQDAEAKYATLEKETSFLNSFTDVSAKFPTATEFKDKIREKVMSGYSVDDATVAVLHAEGKYQSPVQRMENVTGGSAPNQITQNLQKKPNEMSSNEKWGTLKEIEKQGGIYIS